MTSHHVSIGEVVTTTHSTDEIRMIGLGSCAGVVMVVPGAFAAAAHILLPESPPDSDSPPGKHADSAIPHLLEKVRGAGFTKGRIKTIVAGGAQVFQFSGARPEFEIGNRNIEAVKEHIATAGLQIDHDDTGGNRARSLKVSVATGEVL